MSKKQQHVLLAIAQLAVLIAIPGLFWLGGCDVFTTRGPDTGAAWGMGVAIAAAMSGLHGVIEL
jgi:hypothetical protein